MFKISKDKEIQIQRQLPKAILKDNSAFYFKSRFSRKLF